MATRRLLDATIFVAPLLFLVVVWAIKDPSIGPVTGKFTSTLLAPEISSQESEPLAGWLKIYDELFK